MAEWNVTTGSLLNLSDDKNASMIALTEGYSMRNTVLGVVGILINIVTFPLVAMSRRLNLSMKIIIFNVVLSDMIFMTSLIIYGTEKSSHTSDGLACWFVVFFLLLNLVMSYYLVLCAAFVCFIAIYKPLRFRNASQKGKIVAAMVGGWVYCISLILSCIQYPFRKNDVCLPMGIIPRTGVSGIATSVILCFVGVISFNFISTMTIRKQQKSLNRIGVPPDSNVPHYYPTNTSITEPVGIDSSSFQTEHKVSSEQSSRSQHIKNSENIHKDNTIQPILSLNNPYLKVPIQMPPPANTTKIAFVRDSAAEQSCSSILPIERCDAKTLLHTSVGVTPKSNPCIIKTKCIQDTPSISSVRISNDIISNENQPSGEGSATAYVEGSRSSGNTGTSRRQQVLSKVRITLLILTTWSCFLSLPFILFMIWLAVFTEDRNRFATAPFGVFSSTLIIINTLSNPFIYSLRFVDWRLVRRNLMKAIRC